VDGHSQRLYIVTAVCSPGKVGKIELDLIPALIQSHWHCADEWLYTGCRLVVRCSESSAYVFIVEDLHLEGEILFELNLRWGTFLMIMTRKGNLMPSVSLGSCGHVTEAVVTLVPIISKTED
jgi:hypothetical protein